MVGFPDYDTYLEHMRRTHPGAAVMTYPEQTGRGDFPHPAFRLVSPRSTRRGPSSVCVAEAVGDGRRAQQHRSASVFAAG